MAFYFLIINKINMEKNKQQTRSYKDIVRENMRLNSQLRKLGSELNRNQNYSSTPKLQKLQKLQNHKSAELRAIQVMELQRRKQIQIQNNKVLLALKKIKNLNEENTKESLKSRDSSDKQRSLQTNQAIKRALKLKEKQTYYNPQFNHLINSSRKISYKNFGNNNQTQITASPIMRLSNISPKDYETFNLHKKSLKIQRAPSIGIKQLQPKNQNDQQLLKWIRQNIIGFNTSYISAVHLPVQTVYVDHTATNRPFKAVEILVDHAKLFAANPHTQFSRFGKFSTQLMHYARDSMLKSFNAPQNKYVVLPTGGGSTGAIQKAVHFLKIREQTDLDWKKPSIFLTPYEHHSNLLPWVQFYDKVQVLAHNKQGTLDMNKIQIQLMNCQQKSMIVSVSAASNVTSKITHLKQLNQVIKKIRQKKQKNIVFAVDCAAFCCHHDLNLSIYDEIDFAFLSPHKNLGGAESCGVLVARKQLMKANKPTFPGGGTVRFVKGYSKNDVMYEIDVFSRQIPGTPPYLGFYRAALSFQLLKNTIGYDFIHRNERRNTKIFFDLIQAANNKMKQQKIDMFINIYGEKDLDERANVITFNYQYENGKCIQHSFVSLLLTDIFGIQVRSGCFCAGPYGMVLLNFNQNLIDGIQQQVENGILINKPGYLRLDLTFYLEEYEVQYIAKAIILIARYHQNFMKLYTVCNDGQVLLLPIFNKNHEPEIYSLEQIQSAYKKIKQQQQENLHKLKNRKQSLQKQLRVGQIISKNPIDFIKKIKSNDKFQVESLFSQ